MAEISAAIAAPVALTQQAVALEVIKQSAQMQQAAAAVLLDSVASVPVSGTHGTNVNISV